VQLLVTPDGVGQVAHIMRAVGRRYVRYVNDRHRKKGDGGIVRFKIPPPFFTNERK